MKQKRKQLCRPYYRTSEILKALKGPFNSGWTGMGPETQLFEAELSRYLGVEDALLLNSATGGLHIAVKLLNLKPGSEIITTPMTFISTNHAILYENMEPVFCDIDKDTGCIDADKIEDLITENSGAIMVVHYAGFPAQMDKINRIAKTYNLPVIEDCAHALGASYRGYKIGNSTNLSVFSFHPVKNLSTSDGGALTTNNKLYRERIESLRWMGIDKSTFARNKESGYRWEYNIKEVGYKYHGNDVIAAIARVGLKYVDEDNQRREEITNMYREGLQDLSWFKFVPETDYMERHPERKSSNHMCIGRVPRKKEFIENINAKGIDIACHYTPNYYYPMYTTDGREFPRTEEFYSESVTLPLHLMLKDSDVKYIIKAIREVWN